LTTTEAINTLENLLQTETGISVKQYGFPLYIKFPWASRVSQCRDLVFTNHQQL